MIALANSFVLKVGMMAVVMMHLSVIVGSVVYSVVWLVRWLWER